MYLHIIICRGSGQLQDYIFSKTRGLLYWDGNFTEKFQRFLEPTALEQAWGQVLIILASY